MMRAIGSLGAILALALAVAQGGCDASDAGVGCSPGQTLRCSCNGSLTGQATCDSSGHEGACDCSGESDDSGGGSGSSGGGSGSSSGSSGSGSGSGGGDDAGVTPEAGDTGGSAIDSGTVVEGGGATPFGQACTLSSDCQTNDCQNFPGLGGNYCTQPCATDSQCPTPPGLGCSGMGYCKVP